MSENSPLMIPPLVNKLNFYGMKNYRDNLLVGTSPYLDNIDPYDIIYLSQLSYIYKHLPYQATPITSG